MGSDLLTFRLHAEANHGDFATSALEHLYELVIISAGDDFRPKSVGGAKMTDRRAAARKLNGIQWRPSPLHRGIDLILLIAALPVLAGFTVKGVKIEKSYYPISGASHAELVSAVRRNGPRAGRAYGLGIIDFFPDYRTSRIDGECRISDANVGLRAQIRLPQWRGEQKSPRSVIRTAKHFESVINAHEMQHVRIAERYAKLIEQRLRKLPAEKSCWAISARARGLIADIKRQHIAAQRNFDNRTRKQIRRLL